MLFLYLNIEKSRVGSRYRDFPGEVAFTGA